MGSWSLDGSGCKGKFCLWPVGYQKFVNSDLKTVEKENPKLRSEKNYKYKKLDASYII